MHSFIMTNKHLAIHYTPKFSVMSHVSVYMYINIYTDTYRNSILKAWRFIGDYWLQRYKDKCCKQYTD